MSTTKEKILVVGGAGFIGSMVVGKLLHRGYDVSIFDYYHQFSNPEEVSYYNALQFRKQFTSGCTHKLRGDVRNATDVQEAIDLVQPDRIVHLAAVTHAPYNEDFLKEAVDSTQPPIANLFLAAKRLPQKPKRFLLASSSMSYGDFHDPIIDEGHLQDPRSIYGSLKFSAERLTIPLAEFFKIPYTMVRPISVFGASDIVGKLAMQKLQKAIETHEYPIGSYSDDGTDYTYVGDTAEGIVLALLSDDAINQAFNISRGRARPIGDVIQILNDLGFDVQPVHIRAKLSGSPKRGAMSHEKAHKLLGFNPQVNLEEGLVECIQYLQQYEGLKVSSKV